MTAPIVLPWPLRSGLEAVARALFDLGDQSSADFLRPAGEAALVSADSVSWRVFKNPLSLFIGGVAAVAPICRTTPASKAFKPSSVRPTIVRSQ